MYTRESVSLWHILLFVKFCMKRLLITLGKVWSLLRQDGLVRGLGRILSMASVLLRPIGSGQVLLISGGVGDSARYRTQHIAEELSLHGIQAVATTQDHWFLSAAVERFQVFVLHRTLVTPKLARMIAKIQQDKKTIVFETDDLVYDPEFLKHMDYYQKMNPLERTLYKNGVGSEILSDPSVTVATTTTSFLAEKLREHGKQVWIVPNKLCQQDLRWADEAIASKSRMSSDMVIKIGYLSGTPSHNKDFATISTALMRILENYPQVRLVLAGPLDVDDSLNQYHERIERLPFVSRHKLFKNIASLDINLAPLEMGNPFCEAKSELKWFEAGIVEVPTVAAATQTFREAIDDGIDGFVASTSDEWEQKIGMLIDNEELRRKMGIAARDAALKRHTTNGGGNEAYYHYLREKIHNH